MRKVHTPGKREAEILAMNAKADQVPCQRCGAAAGQPCRSCLGNPTMPHTARVMAAGDART